MEGFTARLAGDGTGAARPGDALDFDFSDAALVVVFLTETAGLTGVFACFSRIFGLFFPFLVVFRAIVIPHIHKLHLGSHPFQGSLFSQSDLSAFRQRVFIILTR